MKATLFAAVLAVLVGTAAFAQEQPQTNSADLLGFPEHGFVGWPRFPMFPHLKNHHVPKEGAAMPPVPEIVDERIKCHEAVFRNPDMVACVHDFQQYMKTHKPSVSADCCAALEKVEDACKPFLKYHQHPLMQYVVSHYCH